MASVPDLAVPPVDLPDLDLLASNLRVGIGLLVRRLRKLDDGELTMPETSALARLDREGPATASGLAALEQISPQSMGATLGRLEDRGLVERRPDPNDGRRVILSLTDSGGAMLQSRRTARVERLAEALAAGFTALELRQLAAATPLIERLARTV